MAALTGLLGLMWTSAAAGAEYYQWRDAQGGLHFGERPPADAIDVQRKGAPQGGSIDPTGGPGVAPTAADHAPFTWEDPAGHYRVRFPRGWDALPDEVATRLWGEAMTSRIDGAFYYDTDPELYTCPCALIAPMPAGDEDALVPSRYQAIPLQRGLGADPVAATGPNQAPVVRFDPTSGQFWFRQEGMGSDGVLNSALTTMRRTPEGGAMIVVVQPRNSLVTYADAVLPLVTSLEPIGEVAPPPGAETPLPLLVGVPALSVVLLVVGWKRGGPKRALLFGSAPLLSGLGLLLAAAANPHVLEWERSVRIPHLVGLSLGLPVLAFVAALVQKRTRSLDHAMSWYMKALLLCLAVNGVNAVRATADHAEQPQAAPAAERPATE